MELDVCRNSSEEETCKELSKELERLQRECYHKQRELQVARQNKSATTAAKQSSSNCASQQQPLHTDILEESFSQESENLEEEEWLYEAGIFEDFDSDGGMEDDWDVNETELEAFMDSGSANAVEKTSTISRDQQTSNVQKKYPPSNFGSAGGVGKHLAAKNEFVSSSRPLRQSTLKVSSTAGSRVKTGAPASARGPSSSLPPHSVAIKSTNAGKSSFRNEHQISRCVGALIFVLS